MTKETVEDLQKQLSETHDRLAKAKTHHQAFSDDYDVVKKEAKALLEDVVTLFRDASDNVYYQHLLDSYQHQSRQLQQAIQDRTDQLSRDQQKLYQRQAELDNRKKEG